MDPKNSKKKISNSFFTGAIALVFLIIGYQTALFIQRAAVARVVAGQDHPDTVYIYPEPAASAPFRMSATPPRSDPSHTDPSQEADPSLSCSEAGVPAPGPSPSFPTGEHRVVRKTAPHAPAAQKVRRQFAARRCESFPFNPNTASVEDLQRLGFSLKQAQSIDRYRQKGGRFRRKSDFARSYVVADSVYQRLEPYIDIPPVDLNLADSAALDALPGIGPYLSSQMVRHRTRLGGFSSLEQLLDIQYFDQEKLDALTDLVTLSPGTPYPLWTLPADSLACHPYLDKETARSIVLYRNHQPVSAWTLEGLLDATVIDQATFQKLSRCRIARP